MTAINCFSRIKGRDDIRSNISNSRVAQPNTWPFLRNSHKHKVHVSCEMDKFLNKRFCFVRYVPCPAMHWLLPKSGPEDCVFWCPTTGGRYSSTVVFISCSPSHCWCPVSTRTFREFALVSHNYFHNSKLICKLSDPDKRQRDSGRGCSCLLQDLQCHHVHHQCGECKPFHSPPCTDSTA